MPGPKRPNPKRPAAYLVSTAHCSNSITLNSEPERCLGCDGAYLNLNPNLKPSPNLNPYSTLTVPPIITPTPTPTLTVPPISTST
eukprot:353323-Chlamydomonas_euryale.AAC.2